MVLICFNYGRHTALMPIKFPFPWDSSSKDKNLVMQLFQYLPFMKLVIDSSDKCCAAFLSTYFGHTYFPLTLQKWASFSALTNQSTICSLWSSLMSPTWYRFETALCAHSLCNAQILLPATTLHWLFSFKQASVVTVDFVCPSNPHHICPLVFFLRSHKCQSYCLFAVMAS